MKILYKTITDNTEAFLEENKSKFLSYAYFVEDDEEVQTIISNLRKNNPEASHFCYAFVIGENGEKTRSSDDGEPSGSAGAPLLHLLLKMRLTNILIVVVRYFGGTKLGKGPLAQAYSESGALVMSNAHICDICVCDRFVMALEYNNVADFEHFLNKYNGVVLYKDFIAQVEIEFVLRNQDSKNFIARCETRFGFAPSLIESKLMRWTGGGNY